MKNSGSTKTGGKVKISEDPLERLFRRLAYLFLSKKRADSLLLAFNIKIR